MLRYDADIFLHGQPAAPQEAHLFCPCLFLPCALFPAGQQRVKAAAACRLHNWAFVLVFGPSGEEGQFADMSEPAGRRCRLLSSAGAELCKQEEQRCSGADRDAGRRICFQNTRRELISLVDPHGPDDLTGPYSVFLHRPAHGGRRASAGLMCTGWRR